MAGFQLADRMKMHSFNVVDRTRLGLVTIFALLSLGPGRAASAQLFSNMYFGETVVAEYINPPQSTSQSQVVQSTAPFQQTVSVDDGLGGQITRSYDIYDAGSTAGILISSSGSITEYNTIGLTYVLGHPEEDTFTLSEPALFTATITNNGSGSGGPNIGGNGLYIFSSGAADSSQTFTGTAGTGLIYFSEGWGIADDGQNGPIDESGSQTFSLTFTAIPEPSSTLLAGIPAAALLLCRRRQ